MRLLKPAHLSTALLLFLVALGQPSAEAIRLPQKKPTTPSTPAGPLATPDDEDSLALLAAARSARELSPLEAQFLASAFAAARNSAIPENRCGLFRSLAEATLDQFGTGPAIALLQRAQDDFAQIDPSRGNTITRSIFHASCVTIAIKANAPDLAAAILEKIEDPDRRVTAACSLAAILDLTAANALLAQTASSLKPNQTEQRCQIARAYYNRGQQTQARSLLDAIRRDANLNPDRLLRFIAFCKVAAAYAETGYLDDAIALLDPIADLAATPKGGFRLQDLELARSLAAKDVALAAGARGRSSDFISIANHVNTPSVRVEMHVAYAKEQARSAPESNYQLLLETSKQTAASSDIPATSLAVIADAALELGKVDFAQATILEAATLAEKMPATEREREARVQVCRVLARAGQLPAADAIVARFTGFEANTLLDHIALGAIEAGQIEVALDAISRMKGRKELKSFRPLARAASALPADERRSLLSRIQALYPAEPGSHEDASFGLSLLGSGLIRSL